jgi:hypothetical protein
MWNSAISAINAVKNWKKMTLSAPPHRNFAESAGKEVKTMDEPKVSAEEMLNTLISSLKVEMTVKGVNDEYTVSGGTGIMAFDSYVMLRGLKAIMDDYHKQFKNDEDCREFLKNVIDATFRWEEEEGE